MRGLGAAFACIILVIALASAQSVGARSASSPRHSGLEPPGGPRQLDVLPGNSPGRTAEGGMGYTDAYGNTLTDRLPEERKPRQRLRPGAYGGARQEHPTALPEPAAEKGAPVWSFK